MSENTDLTYYQKNRDLVLSKTETYLKKEKTKKENMEKIDIPICLKKKNKD